MAAVLAALLSACGPSAEKETAAPPAASQDATAPANTGPSAETAMAKAGEIGEMVAGLDESSQAAVKRYGIESGRIEYRIEGMQADTETIQWDQWGNREVGTTKAKITAGPMTIDSDQMTITKPDFITTVDLAKRTASRTANPIQEMMAKTNSETAEELGLQMVKQMGGTKTGSQEVLGRTCDVWEIADLGTKVCVWKGLTLKLEATLMGMTMTKVATKFEEGVPANDALFTVPEGITVADAPSLGDLMKGMPAGAN